jgi:hypothetical protein
VAFHVCNHAGNHHPLQSTGQRHRLKAEGKASDVDQQCESNVDLAAQLAGLGSYADLPTGAVLLSSGAGLLVPSLHSLLSYLPSFDRSWGSSWQCALSHGVLD